MEQTEEEIKQDEGKELKNYQASIKKLEALLGSPKPLTGKKKLPKDDMASLASALFKEENEAFQVEIKTELKELIKKKIEFDKLVKSKKDEVAKAEKEGYKSFAESANKLFNKIESVGEIEKSYYDALKATTENTHTPE